MTTSLKRKLIETTFQLSNSDSIDSNQIKLNLQFEFLSINSNSNSNQSKYHQHYNTHWQDNPNLINLLHIIPTIPTTQILFKSSGLDATITGYKEVSKTTSIKTALNSTDLLRQPTSNSNFIRGKSNYFPFRPGGLPDIADDQNLVGAHLTETLEKAFDNTKGK
jgi:antiviral helicase SKI2